MSDERDKVKGDEPNADADFEAHKLKKDGPGMNNEPDTDADDDFEAHKLKKD